MNFCKMVDFEKGFRTSKVRQTVYSPREMDKFKIRKIYNMVGDMDHMDSKVLQNFMIGCLRVGSSEVAILETAMVDRGIGNPLKVATVMIFGDRYMWYLFALSDGIEKYKDGGEWDPAVLDLLN